MTPTLLCDGYKIDHRNQFNPETEVTYNNVTPRKSRIKGIDAVVVAGLQYYNMATLIELWNKEFFEKDFKDISEEFLEEMTEYTLSKETAEKIGTKHWEALHKLGYLPLHIKALPEGHLCPIRVPLLTMKNTHKDFYWLPEFLETDMQSEIWGIMTAATISREFYKIFLKWAIKTGGDVNFVPFQGHNFSYRGMLGRKAAVLVDMGHLMGGFVGSDTIPGRKYLKKYYKAKQRGFEDIISCSVAATEHAVMCTSTGYYIKKNNLTWERYGEAEFEVFKRLITEVYPTGIVSIVSDTWDLWKVLMEYLVILKDTILARDGKVVIRPDSGDPVKILCGEPDSGLPETVFGKATPGGVKDITFAFGLSTVVQKGGMMKLHPKHKGVVELLWDVFGGTVNAEGYKVLDPHIGCIYGDSITMDRAETICSQLADKGFCSTNWVAGIGSYTYQYVTRDTLGFAHKATYAEVNIDGEREGIEIFKDPITDDGMKKSARGLMRVDETMGYDSSGHGHHLNYTMVDQVSWAEEAMGALETIFLNGKVTKDVSLQQIRRRVLEGIKISLEQEKLVA